MKALRSFTGHPIDPHGDLRYEAKAMRAAFLAGIEHERKRLLGGKPDGWAMFDGDTVYAGSFRRTKAMVESEIVNPEIVALPVKLVVLDQVDEKGGE